MELRELRRAIISHTTTIKSVKITDIRALQSAVAELQQRGVNCALLQDSKPRMYYENQYGNCDYVLRLDDSRYDVGFTKQEDGSYAPVFDEWNHEVANSLGADAKVCPIPKTAAERAQHQIGQMMQLYGKHAAINAAVAQGYIVEDASYDAQGNINLTLAGM